MKLLSHKLNDFCLGVKFQSGWEQESVSQGVVTEKSDSTQAHILHIGKSLCGLCLHTAGRNQ